jgi:hypothetical protein
VGPNSAPLNPLSRTMLEVHAPQALDQAPHTANNKKAAAQRTRTENKTLRDNGIINSSSFKLPTKKQ